MLKIIMYSAFLTLSHPGIEGLEAAKSSHTQRAEQTIFVLPASLVVSLFCLGILFYCTFSIKSSSNTMIKEHIKRYKATSKPNAAT